MWAEATNRALRRVPVWILYIGGLVPAAWLVWLGATGGLGPDPVRALEQGLGERALQLLVLVLAITPLRRWTGVNLLRFRRALGVLCFVYVLLHLLVWLGLDLRDPGRIWAEVIKRPYIMVGVLAFVLMVPLAVTSNNASVRRLGRQWRRLHRLTYMAAILGAVHFIWLAKGFQIEPLVYLGLILGFLLLRIRFPGRESRF